MVPLIRNWVCVLAYQRSISALLFDLIVVHLGLDLFTNKVKPLVETSLRTSVRTDGVSVSDKARKQRSELGSPSFLAFC